MAGTLAFLVPTFGAGHREAPITALDQKADITDWFTFVSPEHPDRAVSGVRRLLQTKTSANSVLISWGTHEFQDSE
jgi:hypothetical protein